MRLCMSTSRKGILILAIVLQSFAAVADIVSFNGFVFHKSAEANVECEMRKDGIIQATFATGNPYNASMWFSRAIANPSPHAGHAYRVSVMVRQTGVIDPQARINLDVIGGDINAVSLNTSCFRKTFWAVNCADWAYVELQFTLPENGIDAKWNQAKLFLTSFSTLSANGTFFFKDYKFEEVVSTTEYTKE